nr:MAG TPA_asm: hypothetical protein [Caudoviricetes sp.]
MSRKFQLKKLSSLTWKVIGTSACQIRESLKVVIKEKDEKIASFVNESTSPLFSIVV